jgi:membrane protease YdiL (CAAX protease family)
VPSSPEAFAAPPGAPARPPPGDLARLGVGLFVMAAATFLLLAAVGTGLGLGARLATVLAALLGLGALPLLGAGVIGMTPADLGLARPRAASLVGAALLGATFWYVNLRLCAPLADLLAEPQQLEAVRARWFDDVPLVTTLLAVALVPAVVEELACRGLLLGALRPRLGPAAAVALSALAFSALHLSLVRAAPTLLLGVVLAGVRLRARELWSPIVVHLLNNAIALLVLARPQAAWVRHLDAAPTATLLAALAGSACGAALIVAGGRDRASAGPLR